MSQLCLPAPSICRRRHFLCRRTSQLGRLGGSRPSLRSSVTPEVTLLAACSACRRSDGAGVRDSRSTERRLYATSVVSGRRSYAVTDLEELWFASFLWSRRRVASARRPQRCPWPLFAPKLSAPLLLISTRKGPHPGGPQTRGTDFRSTSPRKWIQESLPACTTSRANVTTSSSSIRRAAWTAGGCSSWSFRAATMSSFRLSQLR